ncbi:hypothetical protein ACLH0G_03695 [Aeromonas rivipollensis]|uniref:hypothetical protein n=1 Tax=Aeromonas rivipollensis TaxID=948519 RepID=UPI003CFFB2A3
MKYINQVRKYAAPVAVVAGTLFASASAFAVDITVPFEAAKTDAMANMDLLTIGLVALALFTFGLGAVLAWSRK